MELVLAPTTPFVELSLGIFASGRFSGAVVVGGEESVGTVKHACCAASM